jgi:hypothetical protein
MNARAKWSSALYELGVSRVVSCSTSECGSRFKVVVCRDWLLVCASSLSLDSAA